MAAYEAELLDAAARLLDRPAGQRGRLPAARVRRSISTSYYALFHFVVEEVATRLLGSRNALRSRRRILSRAVSHGGAKKAFGKVAGQQVDRSVEDFFRLPGAPAGPIIVPVFVRDLARLFADAQAKRHDADYNMNALLSASDAKLLQTRVNPVVTAWKAANGAEERDFKHALCVLVLLKGELRAGP